MTANIVNTGISIMAFGVSATSLLLTLRWRSEERRRAGVTAYFHRNRDKARVQLPDGQEELLGYSLVIWNRGPAVARDVTVSIASLAGDVVLLRSLEPGELPLPELDRDGHYPIPWAPQDTQFRRRRRFTCTLTWSDGFGHRSRRIPLRRGEVG